MKLVINTGRKVATVARELGLNEATLGQVGARLPSQGRGWRRRTGGLSETERAELPRLRRENSDLNVTGPFYKCVDLLRPGSLGYEREAFELMLEERSSFTVSRPMAPGTPRLR